MYVILDTTLLEKTGEEYYLVNIDYKKRLLTYNKHWEQALNFRSLEEAMIAVESFPMFKPFTIKFYA